MKLDQLQHLVAIVEQGSLRAPLRRLGVPQPALTRSLRALERELGVALFLRETSGMVLTPVGLRFHGRASAIVHEAARARDEFSQTIGDDAGTLVVAPNMLLRARSAMSIMVAPAHSDLLAMLPVQWASFPLTGDALSVVSVRGLLPAPSIVLVRNARLPLPPAAEFFCDLPLRQAPVAAAIN